MDKWLISKEMSSDLFKVMWLVDDRLGFKYGFFLG